MKVADYIAATMGEQKLRERCGITPPLYRYHHLYTDYCRLLADGEKKAYIYAKLADECGLHPRNVRRLIKKYERNI